MRPRLKLVQNYFSRWESSEIISKLFQNIFISHVTTALVTLFNTSCTFVFSVVWSLDYYWCWAPLGSPTLHVVCWWRQLSCQRNVPMNISVIFHSVDTYLCAVTENDQISWITLYLWSFVNPFNASCSKLLLSVRRVQRHTGLTHYFKYLTFGCSSAQDWAPEFPNVKN